MTRPSMTKNPMSLEAHMRFASRTNKSGVHLDIYRTEEGHLVESMVYTGEDYQNRTYIAITTQIGCPVGCDFCKVSELPLVRNITPYEYLQQVSGVVENVSDVPWHDPKRPMKISLGRAGEPFLNKYTIEGIEKIANAYSPNFQIFSVMPSSPTSSKILEDLIDFAKDYDKPVQLNISMHTSNEERRRSIMPQGHLMSFKEINDFGAKWSSNVNKRKINLSFLLIENNEFNINKVREIFDPKDFVIRLTFYLPSSKETARKYTPSDNSRMTKVADEARDLGYKCIEARAGPIERVWDSRPYSGFKMLRDRDPLDIKLFSIK